MFQIVIGLTKYVVGAMAKPPKNPSRGEKYGKIIARTAVRTAPHRQNSQ